MSTDTWHPSTLRRGIGGPLLFAFILGDVLGAGIYVLMGVLAERVGGMLWAPLLLALLLALLTAGSYAELVTKYPRAGGAAVFAERAFKNRAHPRPGVGQADAVTARIADRMRSCWRRTSSSGSTSPSSAKACPSHSLDQKPRYPPSMNTRTSSG